MSDKETLQPCPCGSTPSRLIISDSNSSKWAFCSGDCCTEWNVEFYTEYAPEGSEKLMRLAATEWNEAVRSEHQSKIDRYRKAIDAIYNHNAASRAAVIIHFGSNHNSP